MQAFYGTVACPVNGAEVTSSMTVSRSTDWGLPLRYTVNYNVRLYLDGSGQVDLSAKELAFRQALMVPGFDFVLKTDTGAISSAAIISRQTASGTRVTAIQTPEAQGGEFVNRRTIVFTVTADYNVANAARAVVSWRETLAIIGNGGPRRVWRFPINGPGIRQVVSPFSLVRAVQSGEGIGFLATPPRPAPIFPAYLVNDAVQFTATSPQFMGPNKPSTDYPVSWSYSFERGDGPLVGLPNLPPGVI